MLKNLRWITYLLAFTCGFYTAPAALSEKPQPQNSLTSHVADIQIPPDSAAAPAADAPKPGVESPDSDAGGENTPAEQNSHYLLMQLSNSSAVCGGEKETLTSGFGLPVRPYCSDGLAMIPLRIAAETFGCSVIWEEAAQKATVTGQDAHVAFTVGASFAEQDGRPLDLGAPVVLNADTVYVPARAFCQALSWYVHYYGNADGEFLLLSDVPVSAGDLAGDGNENDDFSNAAPDENLLFYKELGDTYLGPSRSMYCSRTLFLRCGCTYAMLNGTGALITAQDSGPAAPIQTADGNVFVPLEYCAQSFGAITETTSDGDLSFVYSGRTAVFPVASGYFIRDGLMIADQNYATMKFDGVVYATVQAVADALGVYYTYYDSGIFSLSAYGPGDFDNLAYYAGLEAAELLLLPGIKGYIALTFDDGPAGDSTARLLDGLNERDVHATFFLCSYCICNHTELMSRYVSEGHEVGNHSASHPNMTLLSGRELETEIDTTNETILQYTGVWPHLFRPPGGSYNERVLSALADRSMSCILWNIDPKDWRDRNAPLVVSRVLSCVKDGSVILMHDPYNTSVDAAFEIIDTLQAEGYQFVTVSDLAFVKGYEPTAGQVCRYFP